MGLESFIISSISRYSEYRLPVGANKEDSYYLDYRYQNCVKIQTIFHRLLMMASPVIKITEYRCVALHRWYEYRLEMNWV